MGRQLSKITLDNSTDICYNYDSYGIRTQKSSTVAGATTNTFYSTIDGKITAEVRDNISINYRYDDGGNIVSMSYMDYDTLNQAHIVNDAYFYITNLQGDVIALANLNGEIVVEYTYDAWGKVTSITGSLASTIGEMNPFRYRGYYFDSDTGYYYLQSRYYDPDMGRFLNGDSVYVVERLTLTEDIFGTNLFAYCSNDPINRIDIDGCFSYKYSSRNIQVTIQINYQSRANCYAFALSVFFKHRKHWYSTTLNGMFPLRIAQELFSHAIAYYLTSGLIALGVKSSVVYDLKNSANPADIGLGDNLDFYYGLIWVLPIGWP